MNIKFKKLSLNESTLINKNAPIFKETGIQCDLIEHKLDVKLASYLKIPKNALFFDVADVKINRKKLKHAKSSQTYKIQETDNFTKEILIEQILFDLFVKSKIFDLNLLNNNNNDTVVINKYALINILEKLSYKSIAFMLTNINELHSLKLIQDLIKLNNANRLKQLDFSISNNNQTENASMENLIKIAEKSRLGVRFNNNSNNEEKQKLALNRFKKAVRFLIINKEWHKNLCNKENNLKEEHFKLLSEYNRIENSADLNKKIQMLFNKDDFKVQRNVNTLITDLQRKILTREKYKRTPEQLADLEEILSMIPRLNTLPKHLFSHVAQLLTLNVFEKGREIVREGHIAVGFYFITNGSCDVFSVGKEDGLLKIDELSSGDTFGECSFKETNPITPHTIITNKRTELIMVIPSDIDSCLSKLYENEREDILHFVNNWWFAQYWDWKKENIDLFAKLAQFIRFSDSETILDSNNDESSNENIYFILKGSVQFIRLVKTKLIRVCTLEKDNYFGVEEQLNANTWYLAKNDTDLISINKNEFLTIHKHAYFLYSQLVEDFKIAIPTTDKELSSYMKAITNSSHNQ